MPCRPSLVVPTRSATIASIALALAAAARAAEGQAPAPGAATPAGVDTRTEPRTTPRVTRKPSTLTTPAKLGAKAAAAKGSAAKGSAAKGSAAKGSAAKGSAARGSTTKASAAKAPAADVPATTSSLAGAARAPRPTVPLVASDSNHESGRDTAKADAARAAVPADSALALASATPPAPAPVPADPNVPGAPNVAGHYSGTLVHAAVFAPIAATVGPGSGAEVLHVQVLLDAARFSPGAISGVWNENTVYALRAFRAAERLPNGDSADADVIERLERRVGPRQVLTEYAITPADVRGPFRRLPSGMYAQAHLDCLCYSSIGELLGERFHVTVDVLRALNPGVDFSHARPGTRITVPNVERGAPPAVARLLIDKRESSMRGLDARGGTRFYLPVTVGSPGLPSPVGRLHVVGATPYPRYHYDPVVLGEARGVAKDALLPPGPNSPVGVLWAQLSRPHVGLHGTPYPEEVGYTMSHGCVRMANWDARWITPILRSGLVVDFK